MKTKSISIVVSSLLWAGVCAASEADRGLEDSLRAQVNHSGDPALDGHHVHIHVHKGVVTLNGHVKTDQQRQEVESLTRNTPGVVAVKDEMRISIPATGSYSAYPVTTRIPVYTTPAPPPVTVVTPSAPIVVPSYPNVRVQAYTEEDQVAAERISDELQDESIPVAWLRDLSIMVRNGNASVKGVVETHEQHEMIIGAIQRAGGVTAIYDELQVR